MHPQTHCVTLTLHMYIHTNHTNTIRVYSFRVLSHIIYMYICVHIIVIAILDFYICTCTLACGCNA